MKEDIKISKADMAKLHNDGEVEIDGEKVSFEEQLNLFMEKNVPTDKSKWSYYKSQAKKKFDVYPSAYANAWAAKQYKAAGGGWRKSKSESYDIYDESCGYTMELQPIEEAEYQGRDVKLNKPISSGILTVVTLPLILHLTYHPTGNIELSIKGTSSPAVGLGPFL